MLVLLGGGGVGAPGGSALFTAAAQPALNRGEASATFGMNFAWGWFR